jgi:hypothetical protein
MTSGHTSKLCCRSVGALLILLSGASPFILIKLKDRNKHGGNPDYVEITNLMKDEIDLMVKQVCDEDLHV